MFLNRLNLGEKEAFLHLAHHIAHSDKNFSSEEQVVIAKYCMEMQMDDISYNHHNFALSVILDTFELESHKKIALLELMALIYADGVVSEEEQSLIDMIVEHFDLNPNLAITYREWAKGISALLLQGEALIHL
ncbi:TerB family tellurite resistance protein [Photobacterium leiognathi]|uniref:TerB family tellurite resistance protein n=1 Tax=Photobacterium leiognathi TaxID=553611 RepID=UPI002981D5F2|nr:TerB family tellurite resistance protein [Photobacterium leiognathi]